MARVLDVAIYIISSMQVDNLKLQKLLYYSQAVHLVMHDGKPLFDESIEAWAYGPVVRSVYNRYKRNGFDAIKPEMDAKVELSDSEIEAIDLAL